MKVRHFTFPGLPEGGAMSLEVRRFKEHFTHDVYEGYRANLCISSITFDEVLEEEGCEEKTLEEAWEFLVRHLGAVEVKHP